MTSGSEQSIDRRTPEGAESVLVAPEQFHVDATRQFGVTGITCGPDGKLYLFLLADDSGEHAVYAVSMDGTIREFAKNFVTEKLPESQRHPEAMPEYSCGLAIDQQGNVYLAATGNRCVMKLTPERRASVILRAEKPWSPTGVPEHNGDIYVLEYDDETPAEGTDTSLNHWIRIARRARWANINEVRIEFPHADLVKVASGNTVTVFNVAGNKYRLVTAIHYNRQIIYTLRLMTHAEYSRAKWKEQL